jgi:hypothetical protein
LLNHCITITTTKKFVNCISTHLWITRKKIHSKYNHIILVYLKKKQMFQMSDGRNNNNKSTCWWISNRMIIQNKILSVMILSRFKLTTHALRKK